jgi:ankyrin repeat protein
MACKLRSCYVASHLILTLSHRFRWIVCQVDCLSRCFPASIRSALDDLPDGLDETYERTLLGIDKQKRKFAQRLFQCLLVSIRPLRVEELAEILAIRFDDAAAPTFNADWRPVNAEEAVLSACSSLIAIVDRRGRQVVQFSHFSVKEYLTSERISTAEERLSFYHVLPEPAHTILAHASLSVLLQLDDKIDRDTIGRFPLALYAARHWVDHAQFKGVSSQIQDVMGRLFDPARPHFAAWVWLYDIDHYWTDPMPTIHPTRPEAVPLYYASLCGFCGLVEDLITVHPSDVNCTGGSHMTPLHAASVKGHLEVASLLLESGADPNSCDVIDRVPLHRISQGGQVVMMESSLEIGRLLVNYGAKVNVTDNVEGDTPLHAAARSGYRDIAVLLVESGTSLDVQNQYQRTPLHMACWYGKLDVSRFLIDRGSDINCRDEEGFIPLHVASRFGHVEVTRLLLDCGSDVNAREAKHWTPLHYASRNGYLDLARLLIVYGADVNADHEEHKTPMHHASAYGHFDIVKLLVEQGANIDCRDNNGHTPLHYAAWNGFIDIAHFLIEDGAAVSARDDKGWTPFHRASYQGHPHIVKFLLECGVDVDVQTENGEREARCRTLPNRARHGCPH